jgi:electron transport complex protein RnfG
MKQPTVLTSLFTFTVALVLFSSLLTFANRWTGPRIAAYEAYRARQVEQLLLSLFPGATSIKKIGSTAFHDSTSDYFCVKKGDTAIGYAIDAFGKGYQSTIHAIAAVDPGFSIKAVSLLYEDETEDMGSQVRDEEFLAQFKGKRPDLLRVITEDEPEDTNAIVAITGATVSSRALAENAVRKAVLFLKKQTGH